jgi:hypothetical protein
VAVLGRLRGVARRLPCRLTREASGEGEAGCDKTSTSFPSKASDEPYPSARSGGVLLDEQLLELDRASSTGVLRIPEEAMSTSGVGSAGAGRTKGTVEAWSTQA